VQTAARAGIQPGKPAAEPVHVQLLAPHVFDIHIGNFQLPPRGRLQIPGNRHHAVVVNVEPGNGVVAPGLPGLLLDGNRLAVAVKLHHAIPFRVVDVIPEDRCAPLEISEGLVETVAPVEDVIPKD
jgi:hypothetical protein